MAIREDGQGFLAAATLEPERDDAALQLAGGGALRMWLSRTRNQRTSRWTRMGL